ncbi:MAG: DUF1552 domain-containing protein [Pseudohongiellaceae bacterium]|jgi:hypothetical protein
MFISKKHLSRRTLLRGAGTAVALPLLESMIPASTALAQTAAVPKMPRLGCIYIPHGATMAYWTPTKTGKDFEYTPILKPLEEYRRYMNIISGLANTPVGPEKGEDAGGAQNHERAAAAFLTAAHPVAGDRAFVGKSFDQVVADALGQDTPLPSVELAIEPSNNTCGDVNFTCSYRASISWKTPSLALPMENNPQMVFERLFGDGTTDEERKERRRQSASLLDSIREDVASLNLKLPNADRSRLDDYLQEVREIERRVALVDAKLSDNSLEVPDAPSGIPTEFESHINLMFDLQVLAYKSDITRISTLMMAGEGSNVRFPRSGVNEGFHNASHHSNEEKNKDQFAVLNNYHITVLKNFFDKLAATPDGDGSLLDHSLVLYGSSMSDANEHNFDPLPILLVGGANGLIEGGRHLMYEPHTPLANLYVGLLDKFGIRQDSFGNSTGMLEV